MEQETLVALTEDAIKEEEVAGAGMNNVPSIYIYLDLIYSIYLLIYSIYSFLSPFSFFIFLLFFSSFFLFPLFPSKNLPRKKNLPEITTTKPASPLLYLLQTIPLPTSLWEMEKEIRNSIYPWIDAVAPLVAGEIVTIKDETETLRRELVPGSVTTNKEHIKGSIYLSIHLYFHVSILFHHSF